MTRSSSKCIDAFTSKGFVKVAAGRLLLLLFHSFKGMLEVYSAPTALQPLSRLIPYHVCMCILPLITLTAESGI